MAIWLMAPDERVLVVGRPSLASVWPRYLLTLGLYGFWHRRRVSVLTSKRVMLGKGILSRQERSIPIHSINDVIFARRGLSGLCEIRSSTNWARTITRVGPLSARTARRFAYELQARLPAD
jgi:hypothetical protein